MKLWGWKTSFTYTQLQHQFFAHVGVVLCSKVRPTTRTCEFPVTRAHPLGVYRSRSAPGTPPTLMGAVGVGVTRGNEECGSWGQGNKGQWRATRGGIFDEVTNLSLYRLKEVNLSPMECTRPFTSLVYIVVLGINKSRFTSLIFRLTPLCAHISSYHL